MTKKAMQEGLSLFGFSLYVDREYVVFEHEDITITITGRISEEKAKLLLMNIPNWVGIVNEMTE